MSLCTLIKQTAGASINDRAKMLYRFSGPVSLVPAPESTGPETLYSIFARSFMLATAEFL